MRMLALVGLWLAMMASTAHAQANQLFLDFDRDGDFLLSTLDHPGTRSRRPDAGFPEIRARDLPGLPPSLRRAGPAPDREPRSVGRPALDQRGVDRARHLSGRRPLLG